jgi:hypothetical protein
MLVGAVGGVLTVIVIGVVVVAVFGVAQLSLEVIRQEIAAPLTGLEYVNVDELVPEALPFTVHW